VRADVHSHLLFAIDDGSKNETVTRGNLNVLRQWGITHLAFTPHYYTYQMPLEEFCGRRERRFHAVQSFPEAEGFSFALGAEVYLTREIFNYEDLSPLCYQGTHRMLVELEYGATRFTDSFFRRLDRLVGEYHVTPVLAHIDRYDYLYSDGKLLSELRQLGCLFQVNLSSFEPFFLGQKLVKLCKEGFVDFLGNDLHSTMPQEEKYFSVLKKLEKKAPGFARHADEMAMRYLFV